jgi:hypothetical protein
MVVVRVRGLTGRKLPQAETEALASRLAAKTCPQTAKALVLSRLVEDRMIDVGHPQRVCNQSRSARPKLDLAAGPMR